MTPTKEELEILFYTEKLNFGEIYKKVEHRIQRKSLRRLFKLYSIPLPPSRKERVENILSKEVLIQEYVIENNPLNLISKKYNISGKVIRKKLKVFGIYEKPEIISKEVLKNLYFVEQLSILDIAKKFGYKSSRPIYRIFKKYNIEQTKPQKNHNKKIKKYINIITKEQIETLYRENNFKLSGLYKKLKVSRGVFDELFKYYGIEKIKKSKVTKIPRPDIVDKQTLEKLYNEDFLSLLEISKIYNLKSNSSIAKLCKKYNIRIRSPKETIKLKFEKENDEQKFPKHKLENLLNKYSVSEICKTHKIPRTRLARWIKEYNLEINYYKNLRVKESLSKEDDNYSPKELALKYNVSVAIIKLFKKNFNDVLYTIEEIKEKLKLYKYDVSNRGFPKQLFYDDKNLYNSILHHTKSHHLKTNKITERIYRLINNYTENQINCCTHCNAELNFYSINVGYGNSNIQICQKCLAKHNGFGVSRSSQKLFWELFESLEDKNNCFFNDLNHEVEILITEEEKLKYKNYIKYLNTKRYYIDFIYNDKIIEFDGNYWHNSENGIRKDAVKDKLLIGRGYKILRISENEFTRSPEQIVKQCLIFLNQ